MNGKKDGGETDVDCGGRCTTCGPSKHCFKDDDCNHQLKCRASVQGKQKCQFETISGLAPALQREHYNARAQWEREGDRPAHCYNKVQDGDETDIDCGGKCDQCAAGMGCNEGIDCSNLQCTDGVCHTNSPTPCPTGSPTGSDANPVLVRALNRRCVGSKCVN
jgi:hypothetical protein